MIRIFSHDNSMVVHNIKNILENNGIGCELKNVFGGSAAGEVPPIEVWPEIWVDELQTDKAAELIEEAMHGANDKTHWRCPDCTEENPPAFEICWSCEAEKPN
ncbi:MAG: DUF2007 domain-containing protein [Oleiphilaceae bacterium]|nr:DUF2007 domain-containing protein [Oleiphilaceae bacterium]